MKVKELIEKLKKEDQEKDVYLPIDTDDYEYYIVHSVREKTLTVLDESLDCVIMLMLRGKEIS